MESVDPATSPCLERPAVRLAFRRAGELLARANRDEARGELPEAARAVREAARALFAVSAREALTGLRRRVRVAGWGDVELERELTRLAAALDDPEEASSVPVRLREEPDAALGPVPPEATFPGGDEDGQPAIERLLREARCHRQAGRSTEAIRLLVEAARRGAPAVVHREWGLALAAEGDPDGALGHVERWIQARPEDPTAALWRAQLLWRSGRRREARDARDLLASRLGSGSFRTIADRLVAPEGSLVWGAAGPPFWWADDDAEEVEADPPPLLVLDRDDHFYRLPLSAVLRDAGFDVADASREGGGAGLAAAVDHAGRLPVGFVVHFGEPAQQAVATLLELRERRELASVPVVAITTLGRRGLDLARIRELGVVGVLDKRMIPEDVVDRLRRILVGPESGRRYERVPAFFPIDLEADGQTTTEYARNLSVGGLGLLSTRRILPNTDVRLRFRLEGEGRDVEISGRVIYSRQAQGAADRELGVFFYPMEAPIRRALEAEVAWRRDRAEAAASEVRGKGID